MPSDARVHFAPVKLRLLLLAAALALVPSAFAAGPSVEARSYLVADGRTGEVLLAENAAREAPIASLTKMMTVLLALERAQLSDVVTVSPEAAAVGESSVRLRAGERLTVRDLVEASLIQSANDAAWALAYHVGRGSASRFVSMMNRRAQRLGLSETHFVRPDGLDVAGHVSSARDMTTLARVLMQKPVAQQIVATRDATIAGGRRLHTWNDLLGNYPGVVGVKTGHTTAAGWSQVAAVRGPGVTVYATLLGSPGRSTRNGDLVELLAWGLSRFRVVPVISAGRAYARAETPYGRGALALVAAALSAASRARRPPARGARRRTSRCRAAGAQGPEAGRGTRVRPATADRAIASRRFAFDLRARLARPRGLVCRPCCAQHVGLGRIVSLR